MDTDHRKRAGVVALIVVALILGAMSGASTSHGASADMDAEAEISRTGISATGSGTMARCTSPAG